MLDAEAHSDNPKMDKKDDSLPTSATAGGGITHRRRRGMLAVLPDSVQHFPYDFAAWKEGYQDKRAQLLSRTKRQRRRRLYNNSINKKTQSSSVDDDLNQETSSDQVSAQSAAVALILVDPNQPYSLQVLDRLVQRLVLPENNHHLSQQQHVHGIVLLLLDTPGDDDDNHDDDVLRIQLENFLRHTGLSLLCIPTQQSSSSSSSWWPWFQTTLNLHTCPALCVLETHTGRRISGTAEEMALEWNTITTTAASAAAAASTATETETRIHAATSSHDPVLQAWRQGRSALSWSQQARAALTVPSAMPCVLS